MSFHPANHLPGCMMPDGGDCCAGHAAVVDDWHRQRREIEQLRAVAQSVGMTGGDWAQLLTLRDVMKTAYSKGGDRLMSVWERDLNAVEAAIAILQPASQPSPAATVETPPRAWLEAKAEVDAGWPERCSAGNGDALTQSCRAHVAETALREIRRYCETMDPSRSETIIAQVKRTADAALALSSDLPQPVRESVLVCPLCGAPDDALACDNLKCPGTAVPRSSLLSSPHGQ